ncbi:MAG: hypothetical protein M1820_003700 [Bogoriella megaspora]|nr:MAG: hypothetical protein M1820_003700 [Bogoriella megaspora]
MFHQGDLQSGITRAIQEAKVVVCFVQGSTLNLTAPKPPIDLLEKTASRKAIHGSMSGWRILLAIDPENTFSDSPKPREEQQDVDDNAATSSTTVADPEANPESTSAQAHEVAASPAVEAATAPQSSSSVQALLQERKARLEAERKAQEEKEKAERIAVAKAKREAAAGTGRFDKTRTAEVNYASQERKRKEEARKERERVRQLLEADKVERKERERQRKEALVGMQSQLPPQDGPTSTSAMPRGASAVQVRLFDGSTIRQRFSNPSTQTLTKDVRPWIDEHLKAGVAKPSSIPPYTFKHILTPLPNKTLEVAEESKTLQELGLTPTATLVLVPVQGYTEAYSGNALSNTLNWLYGLITGAWLMLLNALKAFAGMIGISGPSAQAAPATASSEGSAATDTKDDNARHSTKMKTLRDTRDEKDKNQLYNGNQLNFEPRPDEKDKKDD